MIAREGAQKILQIALHNEVQEFRELKEEVA